MGNAESQNVDHEFYGEKHASLGRKHTSRSLRLSHKTRRTRHASSGKAIHRNSEVSTRSSSTPSIPQSLAENGLEPFSQEGALDDFGDPIWVDRVDMGLRPVSYTDSSVTPSVDGSMVLTAASVQSMPDSEESRLYGDDATFLAEGGRRQRPYTSNGPTFMETASFKKKRSKSADIWREDSLEFSLSDLSQEHLTSNEEILGSAEEKDCEEARGMEAEASPRQLSTCQRANSLGDLYAQKNSGVKANGGPRNRFSGYCRNLVSDIPDLAKRKMPPAAAEETPLYSNYNTLPCRKSHCLSEGATNPQMSLSKSMQGRRAKTAQDVNTGEGSEFADSGIEGATTDTDLLSRRSNATNSSYSPPTGRAFVGSDSGSSSTGDAARQGVYENFRRELEMSTTNSESLEEAGSAHSDEQSSGTLSSPGQSDILLTAAQGTVRKAGALAVKNFLVHKKNKKVESATRRKWKHYWVSLKGCTLFFYESDGRSGIDHNSVPKHAVWVENSIVQAVPEHPKKDFVFCLSNSLGDAFLFQTTSQTELENWITAIHSACAAAVARHHHKEDTLRLLKSEIKKLEQKIDMDEKMKKMGEMQLSSVTDSKKKKTILDQIFVWEQNLEQFQMDLFRFRCYLASLQGGELPNPKRLLAFASRPTKVAMGRLGIFSVSSFHALVAARTGEIGMRRRTQAMSRSASKRRSRFSSLWGLDTTSKKKQGRPTINQVFGEGTDAVKKSLEGIFDDTVPDGKRDKEVVLPSVHQHNPDCDIWVHEYFTPSWFCLPNDQPALTVVRPGDTARDTLELICKAHQLDHSAHYLRLKFLMENKMQVYIPQPEEDIYELLYKEIEICSKVTQSIHIEKSDSAAGNYGFSLSSVDEDGIRRLYVNSVKETGLASKKGLKAGDEVLEINNRAAGTLNSSMLKDFLSQPSLGLLVRTYPELEAGVELLENPPHRVDGPVDLGESALTFLTSNPAGHSLCGEQGSSAEVAPEEDEGPDLESSDDTDHSSKSTEQVAAFCRSLHEMNTSDSSPSPQDATGPQLATTRQLSDADKLRKVICELLETERTYVKDLNCLMERYLKPLQKETFLTQDELDVLFGNLTEMVEFQVEFLKTLEDGVRLVPDLEKLEKVDQFKKVLFSLGGSFLYYADRFKLYSAFCASHTKVPKVLVKAKTDTAFKAFLDAQNPRQQHSSTLESYLIKPIQRVLKYPLLLRELFALTDAESEEHYHLDVAIKTMNKVASHINEMQKIHEEFGAVFDQLIAEQTGEKKEVADLSMGDLLLHTTVIWLNPPASLGKWKKEPELAAFVFKTAVVLVYKDGSKQKKKLVGSHRLSIYEEWDPFRFRHMIPTEALQVRALPTADAEANAVCEIVHVKSESEGRPERVFHLCCSSPESRKDFLKAVHSILRDKHRRQLLKTESLPSSQQYIPFGGKRLCALKGARPAMSRAVSAPSKSLGRRRRRLARNRFTIDSDAVSASSPEKEPQQPPGGGDTDRWVEEQFDLAQYEEQDDIKETDILSDDDEFCESVKGTSEDRDLPEQLQAASISQRARGQKTLDSHASRMTQLKKQAALSGINGGLESASEEVIWVRREDFAPSRKLNTEI
ncbi:T-lymphoma invasion and metastasis-inducing protein 1 isoform X1 [Onychomys torridus]|uniref:T-lymphoma invasion and metastasis-inducing protein 1 isoform X1 n=1 Tax=Onychomys torridus TaxID=38674 RepID=UPI00167F83F3|nr:T-lymphoma invasion and metastasis-inducing protein 1 isoform X1 [Onychomys torridus]XP_036059167.1 T-lymphoma invasion and metastasis-inducing protein 1 isoform X1 [Onychomys torridus]XP_036059168.1 T-lymphoma invasion and metastasis-inducing protein 1 isoform X1 [Onychomys torridus]XP_036059169.1 T-lymphoma invasion and metastasis-inducing protein 1 isoform X1 [Onychomys torridus]XP_036059170.1 T-lymphoma invasion and metastasis-inducing protein 1 isoform X1 [Onychomys torridus]XP_0360591